MANPTATFTAQGRGYYNWSSVQRSIIADDYSKVVDQDDPGNFLSALLMTRPESAEVASGKEFYTWAGELTPRNGTVTATTTTGGTTVTVTSSAGLRKYDVMWFPSENGSGQHCRITAITGLDITVQRIAGATTIASGDAYYVLGEAVDELESTSAEDNFMAPAKVTNRIQALRRAWALSVTEMATATRMGVSFAAFKADQARQDFTKDVAHTFWFAATSVTATTVVTSRGINDELVGNSSAYKINVGGELAYDDWTDAMKALAPFAKTREYLVLGGEEMVASHADLGTTATISNLRPEDSKYGFKGRAVIAADFQFDMVYERVLSEVGSPFSKYAYILDPSAVKCYHLRGLKFKLMANIHADPGGQIRKSQYESHIGLGITWPKRCAYFYGIAS